MTDTGITDDQPTLPGIPEALQEGAANRAPTFPCCVGLVKACAPGCS
jgi:hypothetical protein